jgi:outer membrane protein assembly factor BamB
VVFTAPDSSRVRCLDLHTGALLWEAARQEDLFLAAVRRGKVLLAGPRAVRALGLADGKEAWEQETGPPTGLGTASEDRYFLPVQGPDGKAAVLALDVDTGAVRSRLPAPPGEVPGNLLALDGHVISQTLTTLSAYPAR